MAMKPSPTQVVVEKNFAEFAEDNYPEISRDDAFELYVADLLLQQRNLNDEQIQYGIVDNTRDGGIDGFFVFLDGVLVQADHPALNQGDSSAKGNGERPTIFVLLTQSKNSTAWAETPYERLMSSLPVLLDQDMPSRELEELFHTSVVEQAEILRTLTSNLAARFPRTLFDVRYVTRAPEQNITAPILGKGVQLRRVIESMLAADAEVSVEAFGAETLYRLIAQPRSSVATLKFRNSILREDGSYLGVATIADYLSFVRSENGELREELFEANVRDYEGDNTVNLAIQGTLSTSDNTEFWWKNNGVTVLATNANAPQQEITLEQPLIVNGLQTTHVLHQAEQAGKVAEDRLSEGILVRIIQSTDDEVRDQVIAGTNRQTRVESPALFASMEFQHQLERYFLANGWFYERRKNRYKNKGKAASRRVSIALLAQAMMTLVLGEPDAARARPATVLNRSAEKVFDPTIGEDPYLKAIQLLTRVSVYLKSKEAKDALGDHSYSNVRFYVLLGVAMDQVGTATFENLKFGKNAHRISAGVSDNDLLKIVVRVRDLFESWSKEHPEATQDSIAKNADFRQAFVVGVAGG